MLRSQRIARVAAASMLSVLVAQGCSRDNNPPAQAATQSDAQAMERGLQQLYKASDPVGAEQTFRSVLARNSAHYGARYQLAVALDRGGRPADARTEWTQVLQQAQSYNDSATIRTAVARLGSPDTASVAAMMTLGLDLLYRQNNPAVAEEQFRKVLQKSPAHYGATYQLATALDKQGKEALARPLWTKVLGMATMYKDERTAATARTRLK
ncbi:MAG TPA: tetratricopeptide repeat protein [Gemmatimonadaceae bacterium]|nr:tetratricopeptide repeat protein [Gemmatimonadaceae bacterium]